MLLSSSRPAPRAASACGRCAGRPSDSRRSWRGLVFSSSRVAFSFCRPHTEAAVAGAGRVCSCRCLCAFGHFGTVGFSPDVLLRLIRWVCACAWSTASRSSPATSRDPSECCVLWTARPPRCGPCVLSSFQLPLPGPGSLPACVSGSFSPRRLFFGSDPPPLGALVPRGCQLCPWRRSTARGRTGPTTCASWGRCRVGGKPGLWCHRD